MPCPWLGPDMRRRDFLSALGITATAWPLVARAQQTRRIYRLGFMVPASREAPAIAAFFEELQLFGFIEGQNVQVIPGGFDVRNDQLTEKAAAVVAAEPDVIVGGPDNYARTLQRVTQTIPIVTMTEDIIAEGLVTSLARPRGNITGISLLSPELDGKRQDILIDAVPGARRIAAMADASATPQRHIEGLRQAALARGIELSVITVADDRAIAPALNAAKAADVAAINFLASPLFAGAGSRMRALIQQVSVLRLPAIYQWPETADQGGLIGYGPSFVQVYRQRARIVARLLRGAKPSDVAVEQPTHFELAINLKTAKSVGHEVPASLMLRADKLIE
jgi:putative tryptophan/tyrosine transport system substrate-binding protein